MSSIKVHIRDKCNVKKGFTLIEILLASSLIGIVTVTPISIVYKYTKIHRTQINNSRESFYINEGFMIIEHEISSAKYVKIKDNIIILRRYDNSNFDYIRVDKDSDVIISYGSLYSSTTNNILKNAKNFKAEGVGQVVYITIETRGGDIYKRCLPLERKKVEEDLY
ncbi:prepilin-type N-terminal cleavage/methylation domain-containing protein [Clostridium sp. DJ247]|uniref:PilW family protein n=1 Tax=Clostridium sp. DJ247 TaxID=2726188 RepID=UPI0016240ED8|nr:competence type IV pilus minor pilin ComGF [Clostridium sp. DJ247]MBC2580312.1 type II secretion system protein [Clostridium sp. DJ247]